MSELDEQFKVEVFHKLDKLNENLNTFKSDMISKISDYKVGITEKIASLPCGEHKEAIRGNRGKLKLIATIVVVILVSIVGLAFKTM